MDKTRITITCYDGSSFEFLQHRPLSEIIESTKETGYCFLVYSNNIQVYAEKTKAGYKMTAYERKRDV